MKKDHIVKYIAILKRYYFAIGFILLTIQGVILKLLSNEDFKEFFIKPSEDRALFIFIYLLITSIAFTVIFALTIFFFNVGSWKLFIKTKPLGGKWYIKFNGISIDEYRDENGERKLEKPETYQRFGDLTVNWQSPIDIEITGTNYNENNEASTKWNGSVVYLNKDELVYKYEVLPDDGRPSRKGSFSGSIKRENGSIELIRGVFKDEYRINSGETVWTRKPPLNHPENK